MNIQSFNIDYENIEVLFKIFVDFDNAWIHLRLANFAVFCRRQVYLF